MYQDVAQEDYLLACLVLIKVHHGHMYAANRTLSLAGRVLANHPLCRGAFRSLCLWKLNTLAPASQADVQAPGPWWRKNSTESQPVALSVQC